MDNDRLEVHSTAEPGIVDASIPRRETVQPAGAATAAPAIPLCSSGTMVNPEPSTRQHHVYIWVASFVPEKWRPCIRSPDRPGSETVDFTGKPKSFQSTTVRMMLSRGGKERHFDP